MTGDIPTLNIVGCGKVGMTIPRLLRDAGVVKIGGLYSRNSRHAEQAKTFIGAGSIATDLASLPVAQLWLLSVTDDAIGVVAGQLAALDRSWRDITVFHCSGLHDSLLLAPLAALGTHTASLHPVHSFADPENSLRTIAGTCCTLEGDSASTQHLTSLFSALPVQILTIDAAAKPLYHAATAMASNYLVGLMATSLTLLQRAGIDGSNARALLSPLVHQTAANIFARGPALSLTGPLARGDLDTIASHLTAIAAAAPQCLPLYCTMGKTTLELAGTMGTLPTSRIEAIARLLDDAAPEHQGQ